MGSMRMSVEKKFGWRSERMALEERSSAGERRRFVRRSKMRYREKGIRLGTAYAVAYTY